MSYFQQHSYPRGQAYHSYSSLPLYGSNPSSHSNLNLLQGNPYDRMPLTPGEFLMMHSNLTSSPLPSPRIHQNSSYSNLSNGSTMIPLTSNDNTLDQLNISRTVILKNLNEELTLEQLLDQIDFGPIEYVKMFSKPAPRGFGKDDESIKNFKVCFISFINSKVSINFSMKYQNLLNLQELRTNLDSKYLKISLNDNKIVNNGLKDYIKLKTLNYIVEFNATRALSLLLRYKIEDFQLEEYLDEIKESLPKHGDFESFKIVDVDHFDVSDSESENEFNDINYKIIDIQIHFNSIDSAIKCYDTYCRKIDNNPRKLLQPYSFIGAKFIKDRCERLPVNNSITNGKIRQSDTSSSSPPSVENDVDIVPRSNFDNIVNENDEIYSDNSNLNLNSISDVEDDNEENSGLFYFPENSVSHSGSNMNLSSLSYFQPPPVPTHYSRPQPHFSPIQRKMSNPIPYHSPFVNSGQFNSSPALNSPMGLDAHSYMYNSDPYNTGNRTIYLGNLHPHSTVEEIANNVRAGGLVESIRFYPEKRNCFITFIDPNIALKFYLNHQVLHQLIIHGYDINVGWAKTHSGPLSREIALAVTAGASRNVYIGIKLAKDKEGNHISQDKPRLPDEQELREDFSKFGELEQINFYHNNDCGFLNFVNIIDAIRLVEMFDMRNLDNLNEIAQDPTFYERYKDFKISFGKDRCGNPPKFSFKKKIGKSRQKIYFGEAPKKEEKPQISDEAAMVFGIIKNEDDDSSEHHDDVKSATGDVNEEKESKNDSTEEIPEKDAKPIGQFSEEPLDAADDEGGNDEEDDDDDDDDDISIIIGSDDTSSTTVNNAGAHNNGKGKAEKKKFYNNLVNTSDLFIPLKSRSNSSNGHKYKQPHVASIPQTPKAFMSHPQYQSYPVSSPYQVPLPHQTPPHFHSGQPSRPHSQRSNSNYGYYHPQMTPYGQPYAMPPSPGGQLLPPVPPPHISHMYYDNSPTRSSFSGSQVMAQYLAKSQSESMFYQPHVVYDHDERRKSKK